MINKGEQIMNFKKTLGSGGLVLAALLFNTSANAADGCKFVLCMGAANPMGIAECAPTVREVLRDLKKGKALPTCKLLDGKSAYVTAKPAPVNPECPKGWTQLPDKKGGGANYFVQGRPTKSNLRSNTVSHTFGAGQNGKVGYNQWDYDLIDGKQVYDGTYSSITCAKGKQYGSVTDTYNRTYYFWEQTKRVNKNEGGFDFTMFADGQPQQSHRFRD